MKSKEKEIYTKIVQEGKRTYFFDIKKSSENDIYLVINESIHQSDGSYEHHRVMIFPEVAQEFQNALKETMQYIRKNGKSESKRDLPNRAGMKWEEDEVRKVVDEYNKGTKIPKIANIFERTTGAIKARLKKEGLIQNTA